MLTMNGGVRIMIVDDDPGIREALRLIAQDLGADIVAEADNGRAAIEEAERYHPQLMLLDVAMPVMGGFPAARHLRKRIPDLLIILVSQYEQKAYAEEALEIGVKGYLVKSAVVSELGAAMDIVMHGGTFVSPSIGLAKRASGMI